MWGRVRDEEQKRVGRGCIAVDEVHSLARKDRVLELTRRRAVVDDVAVLIEVVVVDVEGRGVRGVPLGPARWHIARATGIRPAVAAQVLADVPGVIAAVLEPHRQRVRGVQAGERATEQDAMVVGVLARQKRGPGGAAERVVDEVVRERRALVANQLLDARQDSHVSDGLVVGHHDEDVRWCLPGGANFARVGDAQRAEQAGEHKDGAGSLHTDRDRNSRDPPGRALKSARTFVPGRVTAPSSQPHRGVSTRTRRDQIGAHLPRPHR